MEFEIAKKLEKVPANGGRNYDNPEFRMMMACSVGSAIRNICICGGVPERVIELLLKIANRRKK